MSFANFDRDGIALRYEDVGEGPPVIFQHGLGGDAAQVAEVFPSIPPSRRITLECRAHGGSESGSLTELSIATFTSRCGGARRPAGLGRAVAGGISMGAAVAFRLAVKRPDLVTALVLSRPAWLFAPAPDNMQPIALVAELLRKHALPIAREIFERSEVAKRLARDAPNNLVSLRGFFANHDPATRAALPRVDRQGRPGCYRSPRRGASQCRHWSSARPRTPSTRSISPRRWRKSSPARRLSGSRRSPSIRPGTLRNSRPALSEFLERVAG